MHLLFNYFSTAPRFALVTLRRYLESQPVLTLPLKSMVLKEQPSLNPVAFVYLLPEDFEGKTYSIHGGGWKNPYLYYRAFVFLVEHLLRNGIKLRTAIAKSNQRAHRFVKSIGFKTFRHSEDKDLMYITLKNLKLSRTYKSFVQAST